MASVYAGPEDGRVTNLLQSGNEWADHGPRHVPGRSRRNYERTPRIIRIVRFQPLPLRPGRAAVRSWKLEPETQVDLEKMIMRDGIDLWNIQIAAAGPELVIDATGVPVSKGSDHIIREAIGATHIHAFHIGAAFEEIGIEEVGIEGVLLDMLPVGSGLP